MTLDLESKLIKLGETLVNQDAARVIVEPLKRSSGFWFGGGNMLAGPDGTLWMVGRFRNHGDSRTGLHLGERGLELAIFRSTDGGQSFEKVVSLSKADLTCDGKTVLSIEGTALRWTNDGVELFVSTEKDNIGYPDEVAGFLKPGTGVWTIDVLKAKTVEELASAKIEPLVDCRDPQFVQVKDPFVYDRNGETALLFCTHPYCWSSSNTAYALRAAGETEFAAPVFDFFPRGFTWDVAMTRGTAVVDVPKVGAFANADVSLMFYDGGECVRNLDEHASAQKRPRGYSCEELGGLAFLRDGELNSVKRLSTNKPMFVSPHGTGCSRYVDVLATNDTWYATWQQAQPDGSQPLVMNALSTAEVEAILSD